jgi:UDP-N-acetylmuramate--alanine ligase
MAQRYHIIGIAGAGMSAIAHVLLDRGFVVSGSDMQRNALSDALAARGAAITIGHDAAIVQGADVLLTTSAARPDHIEIAAARAAGIPVRKRADLWREWSRERRVVAVAGTHGKTTTTALIALMLQEAGFEPGFLVGGEAPDLGVNARWGDPQAPLVIEADEYDRAFLSLSPHLAVVTNVEWDHVDIYPTADAYDAAFATFAQSVSDPHRLIVCGDDEGALKLAIDPQTVCYGIDEVIARDPASCRLAPLDWAAANVTTGADGTRFDIWRYDRATFGVRLAGVCTMQLVGAHNVRNALAALAAATQLGVSLPAALAALARYGGTKRRFEVKGSAGGVLVIDDYAHHPSEVRATLAAARARFPDRRLIAYLQPHTYSRTRALLDEWAHAFGDADVVRIGAIYAARETPDPEVSAARMAAQIAHRDVASLGDVADAATALGALVRAGDVLLTLGAGDGNRVGEMVLDRLKVEG